MKNFLKNPAFITMLLGLSVTLLSFHCHAQHRYEVKDRQGRISFAAEFETLEELNKWKADQLKLISGHRCSWGLVERVVPRSEATIEELNNDVMEEIPAEYEGFDENGMPKMVQPEKVRLRSSFVLPEKPIDVTSKRQAEKDALIQKRTRIAEAKERIRSGCPGVAAVSTTAAKVNALLSCFEDLAKAIGD